MYLMRKSIALSQNAAVKTVLPLRNKPILKNCTRLLSDQTKSPKMVDPKRVVSYEEMLKVIHEPHKVVIDVRNQDEVNTTGKIPSSINIPLGDVKNTLAGMSQDDFQKIYKRGKPSSQDEIIFYCKSGTRSTEALDQALKLGYKNSKTYLGSWTEWSSKKK